MTTATVSRLDPHEIDSDIIVDRGSAGAPVFGTDGEVVGIATLGPRRNDGASGVSGIARIDGAKDAIAKARTGISTARPPEGIHLPVEPARPFPLDALERVVAKRAGSLDPYPMAAADFDVSFITPVNTYGAQHLAEQTNTRARASRARGTAAPAVRRPLDEFGNWTDYVAGFPAVLMIRATPKLVEGFWAAAGRAAAQTQGIGLPPTKHVKAPFASLRLYCGGAEVPPIHPFKIERHVVGRDGSENPRPVYEGLYVFAPDAVGPRCGTVKLVLFSERDPARGDAHVVDARIVEQIWQDFASYRDGK